MNKTPKQASWLPILVASVFGATVISLIDIHIQSTWLGTATLLGVLAVSLISFNIRRLEFGKVFSEDWVLRQPMFLLFGTVVSLGVLWLIWVRPSAFAIIGMTSIAIAFLVLAVILLLAKYFGMVGGRKILAAVLLFVVPVVLSMTHVFMDGWPVRISSAPAAFITDVAGEHRLFRLLVP